jgi:hypothetical protein
MVEAKQEANVWGADLKKTDFVAMAALEARPCLGIQSQNRLFQKITNCTLGLVFARYNFYLSLKHNLRKT